ncbi:MAG: FecR domain-containing protein [Desulfuromonadales bacterium]
MQRYPVILLFVIMLLSPLSGMAAQVGVVSGIKGTVQIRLTAKGPLTPLKKGADVSEGQRIVTGADGWAELTLNDKSIFTLAHNTDFEVTSFLLSSEKREGNFSMTQGKLRASVVKLAGRQSDMTVKSGTVVAGVKGTEFMMMSQGEANVLFGNEGTVAVSGDGSGIGQPLTAGTMTENTRGMTPVEPLAVEPGSPVAEARDIMLKVTSATPPADWVDSGRIGDIIARWNINYGHYLADAGKYAEAQHVFQIALDLSRVAGIRCDAHMERGAVYSRFLSKPALALEEYRRLLDEYPDSPQAETALYISGQLFSELGSIEEAKSRFRQYLKRYPEGRHAGNAETLLMRLESYR